MTGAVLELGMEGSLVEALGTRAEAPMARLAAIVAEDDPPREPASVAGNDPLNPFRIPKPGDALTAEADGTSTDRFEPAK